MDTSRGPELDRIEFCCDESCRINFYQRGDPQCPLQWRKVSDAASLLFLGYMDWALRRMTGPFLLEGAPTKSLAASLGDAMYNDKHPFRQLFQPVTPQGSEGKSVILQVIGGDNPGGQDRTRRRRFYVRQNFLPPDCIEVYWEGHANTSISATADLAALLRRTQTRCAADLPAPNQPADAHRDDTTEERAHAGRLSITSEFSEPNPALNRSLKLGHDWIAFLEKRYETTAFQIGDTRYPIASLWANTATIKPFLMFVEPDEWRTLVQPHDQREMAFIREQCERGPIKEDPFVFRMNAVQVADSRIRKNDAYLEPGLGFYYDAMIEHLDFRRELDEAIMQGLSLNTPGTLPFREYREAHLKCNPLWYGGNRCAVIATRNLLVVKHPNRYECLLSAPPKVKAPLQKYDPVPPAVMFATDAKYPEIDWSVELTAYQQLLKDSYDPRGGMEPPDLDIGCGFYHIPPIRGQQVDCFATGIISDLITLSPDITTIIIVHAKEFLHGRILNEWDWREPSKHVKGLKLTLDAKRIPEFLNATHHNLVPASTLAMELGFRWLQVQGMI